MDETNFRKIWDTLYVLVSCFNPKTDIECQAMHSFFESLKFILPDPSMRYLLMTFISYNPLDLNGCSAKEHIKWVTSLNNYMCRNMRRSTRDTYDIICKLYDPRNITKKKWGNSVWYFIHYTALHQPNNLTQDIAFHYKHMMITLTYLLPCEICRGHLKQHLQDFPIDNYLRSGETLFEWTFQLHNKVNISLNKPVMTYKDARALYI